MVNLESIKKEFRFGEIVKGYNIPVLNEREIRASAGILFFILMIAIMPIVAKEDFTLLKYFITLFLVDFTMRIFVNPKYSPTLIVGRLIVSRQNPEYVGAAQKMFAWIVGWVLAVIMFTHLVAANLSGPISSLICMTCVIFLFCESAFGICIGCLFYKWFFKEKAQYCHGESCSVKDKQDIQKTSMLQIFIVIAYIAFIFSLVFFFNNSFSKPTGLLWSKPHTVQSPT